MPSLADTSAQLLAAALPVLFIDTCSLVDVIRAPIRHDKIQGCVESAAELLQRATSAPPQCVLVAASFVPGEWLAHAAPTTDDLKKYLARLDNQAACFHDACGVVGITPRFGRPTYQGVGLADRLHDLSKQLLDCALHLHPQNETNLRAFARAATKTPTLAKGRRDQGLHHPRRVPGGLPVAPGSRLPPQAAVLHLEDRRLLRCDEKFAPGPGRRIWACGTRFRNELALGRPRAQDVIPQAGEQRRQKPMTS